MKDAHEPESTEQQLGERLRAGDEFVLQEILRVWAPAVRGRLRRAFASSLDAEDLDDIISMGLYRLWRYRSRFDPEKGSLSSWLYLISRSIALEWFRKQKRRPRHSRLASTVEPAAKVEKAGALAEARGVRQLRAKLDELPDLDREILLYFAAVEGEHGWATSLATKLNIPSSTIRSRKSRALQRLRAELTYDDETQSSRENIMAPNPDPRLPPEDDIEDIAERLLRAFSTEDTDDGGSGLNQVKAEWNVAHEQGELENTTNREGLEETYRWLSQLSAPCETHRKRLRQFLQQCNASLEHQQLNELIEPLERVLSAVTTTFELRMPREIRRQKQGVILLAWLVGNNDAEIQWQSARAPDRSLHLRSAIKSAFSIIEGGFTLPSVDDLVDQLVDEVARRHELCFPGFSYPDDLKKDELPQRLLWKRLETQSHPPEELPEWMRNIEKAPLELPSEFELDIERRDAELAAILERVICAAAKQDWASRHQAETPSRQAEQTSAVETLVDAMAERMQCPPDEVAAIFIPRLLHHRSRNHEECSANAHALHFLWSQLLTEP